jgi:uncharacterized membrane protein
VASLELLFMLGIALLVIGSIAALNHVRRLERRNAGVQADLQLLLARIYALEKKQAQFERRSPEQPPVVETSASAPVPLVTTPTSERVLEIPPVMSGPSSKPTESTLSPGPSGSFDLERLIADRVLMCVGMLLVLVGVAYFLKYAFDSNWIGPTGRVSSGLLAGASLLIFSQWLSRRGFTYFSEGITALGGGVLYLALYAAWHFYQVMPNAVAFLLMVVVTAALLVMAIGRNSERLAGLGLLGGFLTPVLMSTGRNAQLELFSYVAALDLGLFVIARFRRWRTPEALAFACTQVYFWTWYYRFYDGEQLATTMTFAAVFFFLFAVLPAIRSRETRELLPEQVAVMLGNAFLYLLTLHLMLWPEHRWALTFAMLALAALLLAFTKYVPERDGRRPASYLLYAGLALTSATLAIPIRLEGNWITMAWVIEGTVLVWSGFRVRLPLLRHSGLLLFAITIVPLAVFQGRATQFLLNARFGVYAMTVACFATALWFQHKNWGQMQKQERAAHTALGILLNIVMLTALTQEVGLFFSDGPAPSDPLWRLVPTLSLRDTQLEQQLGFSLLWTMYAAALTVAGVRRQRPILRYQALVLFGIVIAKVFFFDLGFLAGFYRIVSSLGLGIVLLIVAFLYQRFVIRESAEGAT